MIILQPETREVALLGEGMMQCPAIRAVLVRLLAKTTLEKTKNTCCHIPENFGKPSV